MLALLRAIRLRLAAPDAVASGTADAAEAVRPDALMHPDWTAAGATEADPATSPPELPAAPQRSLPAAHPFRELSTGEAPRADLEPAAGRERTGLEPAEVEAQRAANADRAGEFRAAIGPVPRATRPAGPAGTPGGSGSGPGAPGGAEPPAAAGPGGPRRGPTSSPPPVAGSWVGGMPVFGTEPVSPIPGIAGIRPAGPHWPGDPAAPVSPLGPARMPGVVPVVGVRPVPPADGMNPADDVELHELQRLLGDSLSLAGGLEEVAVRLRAALVQAQPTLLGRLPGGPGWQTEQLAQALTWLVQNLEQPPQLAAACGRLGAALAECGVLPQQLQLAGAALAEAMRAGISANGWRQDFDQAWRSTWHHAYEWIVHGMASGAYRPVAWTAVVVGHERRRDDLAVLRLRPYLPMPYRAGQFARIEVCDLPGVWRPYSLAGDPRRDNIVELHVRAKGDAGVSGSLVYRTQVGDTVRIGPAEGDMGLPESGRDLLMIAGDTGIAPLKALLSELAATGDRRSAVLFWGARSLAELYDIEDVAAIAGACRRATVVPVISEGGADQYASGLVTDAVAEYGEWSAHEVYLAGPPSMLAATSEALQGLGVAPERIHHDVPE